jgi:hypothetical protein
MILAVASKNNLAYQYRNMLQGCFRIYLQHIPMTQPVQPHHFPQQMSYAAAAAAFRREIAASIAAGYTLRTIWEAWSTTGRINCCYSEFLRSVKRTPIGHDKKSRA